MKETSSRFLLTSLSFPCPDVRDIDGKRRDDVVAKIRQSAMTIAERRNAQLANFQIVNQDPPALSGDNIVQAVVSATEDLGFKYKLMKSRAYHDSLFMARSSSLSSLHREIIPEFPKSGQCCISTVTADDLLPPSSDSKFETELGIDFFRILLNPFLTFASQTLILFCSCCRLSPMGMIFIPCYKGAYSSMQPSFPSN